MGTTDISLSDLALSSPTFAENLKTIHSEQKLSSMPGLCGYATKNVSRHIQQQSTHTHTFSLDTVHISHTVNVLPYICFTFTQGRIHEHATSVHAVAQSHIQGSEKKKTNLKK